MAENRFGKQLRQKGAKLSGVGTWARRGGHSFTQALANIWGGGGQDKTALAANVASTTAGAIATGASIAAVAGSAAVFVTAMTGPIGGAVLGIVGLGLLVYDSSSDRETHHEELRKYIYTLVDDAKPTNYIFGCKINKNVSADLKAALNHALYLLQEGPAQFKSMSQKYDAAKKAFGEYLISSGIADHLLLLSQKAKNIATKTQSSWRGDELMNAWGQYQRINPRSQTWRKKPAVERNQREKTRNELQQFYTSIQDAKSGLASKWDEGCQQGRPIYEWIRRLLHFGNYMQCAHIIDVAMVGALREVDATEDPMKDGAYAKELRKFCDDISGQIDEAEGNIRKFEDWWKIKTGEKYIHMAAD